MKPFRLRCLRAAIYFLASATSAEATTVNLQATALFDASASCLSSPAAAPVQVTATIASTTCAASAVCGETSVGSSMFPATVCSTTDGTSNGDFIFTKLPALYGASPFVVVEKYSSSTCAVPTEITGITAYLADGSCHKTATGSFRATRLADQSSAVKTYTDSACAVGEATILDATAAQVDPSIGGNTCTAGASGIVNTKVYGGGASPSVYSSIINYDTNTGVCVSPVVPTLVATTPATSCTATSACGGSGDPYTRTACTSILTYKSDMATAFGSNPYVIVEKYATGQACASTQLSAMTTYLADGKCHKLSTTSYRATRKMDGSSLITTYTDQICTAGPVKLLEATAGQVTGNSCTASTSGIVDTKVYGGGATPLYLQSIVNYDTSTGTCISPVVPTQLVTTVVLVDACAPTTVCAGTVDPFTSTVCSSTLTYKSDMAAAFGVSPYVIVESYTSGKSCDPTQLSGITTYLADGKCHKTATASYRATRMTDTSSTIKTYTDVACTTGEATLLDATVAQVTGNSCTAGVTGIVDTKVYVGGGATADVYSSTINYDTSIGLCVSSVVPTLVETTPGSSSACTSTSGCGGGSNPYTKSSCTSILTYKSDMAAAFGSNPYVIVEKYPNGQSCLASGLTKITTYLADGKCHKTSTASYRATRKADGSSGVTTYTDTSCAVGGATLLDATTSQVTDSTCIPGATNADDDRKVHGGGATPLYLRSIVNYDTSTGGCKSPVVPTQLVTGVVDVDVCAATVVCGGSADPYTSTACSSTLAFKSDMAVAFGSNPYVIVQTYQSGQSCDATKLTGITTYLADGKCHKTGPLASYVATRALDGSATVISYTDSAACTTTGSTLSVTAGQASGNSCTAGATGILDMTVYGDGATTSVYSSTVSYGSSTGGCQAPVVPTQVVTTPGAASTCLATSVCAGTAAPYSSTSCTSILTYKSDMAAAFGSKPYVIVEQYRPSQSCGASKLIGMTTYLADGKCRKTVSGTSYRATRKIDGTSTVQPYTDDSCALPSTLLAVSPSQAMGSVCISGLVDVKVYGGGETPLYLKSTVNYDTSVGSCKSPVVPTLLVTSLVAADACTATAVCAAGTTDPFTSTSCSPITTFKADVATAFGSSPYVTVESYASGQTCDPTKLTSSTTYLADGKCHKTASASYRATRKTDGSSTIKMYTDLACTAGETTLLDATAVQVTGNSCTAGATGIVDTKIYGGGATTSVYSSIINYDTNTGVCVSPVVPTLVATTPATSCTATSACGGNGDPYTRTACTSILTYKSDMATAFGSNPYVTVEKYTTGQACASTKLTGMTTYLADGKCHKMASGSYRATRKTDGSSSIKTYTGTTCGTVETILLDATAAQVTGNSCTASTSGIVDTKVYGGGATPLYLTSVVNYDTKTGNCKSPVVPTQLVTTVVAVDTCTATTACVGTADPYTSTACSSTLAYKSDMAAAFGSNPYVIVESYTSGKSCDPTQLSGVTTYLADGKCHISGTASYRATRTTDGSSTIKTYTGTTCAAGEVKILDATAAQVTGNSCTASTSGIVDTKVYGGGATPLYLQSVVNYDTSTGSCKSPVVPTQLVTTVVAVDACAPTTVCAGSSAPFTSTACSSTLAYKSDMATAFGVNPYVIVESYTSGKSCDLTQLSGVTTYLADGKCHKTATASYRATRKADGSSTIKTYTDLVCATDETTLLDATAAQVTGNSCTVGATGIVDTKVYGGGATTSVYSSIINYDTNTGVCVSPVVPTLVATTPATSCTATSACGGSGDPYTRTACTSILTYKSDMATAFGSNPYVIVEKYATGQACASTKLTGVTTYLADGKCHKTSSGSYRATRTSDGSSSIKTYTDPGCTAGQTALLDATSDQVTGNSCTSTSGIVDTMVYGGGATPLYLQAIVNYDTSTGGCMAPAIPTEFVAVVASPHACVATTVCAGSGAPYSRTACSGVSTFKTDMVAAFGSSPYVVVESYASGQSCDALKLTGITTYLADGKCHKTSTASYRAIRKTDGSSTVKTYTDFTCAGGEATLLDATAAQVSDSTCNADMKVYGGGVSPLYLQSTMSYDTSTGGCKSPVTPKLVLTVTQNEDTCTATTSCAGTADPFTSTACSSTSTYKSDIGTAFGSNPYVIVEKYTSGQSCDATKLTGITTYLADGKCHIIDSMTSYRGTRTLDGSSSIKTYTDPTCTAGETTLLDASTAQVTGNSCTASTSGIVDTKVYGGGATPLYLQSVVNYDTSTGSCKSPVVPTQLVTTVVAVDACAPTTVCAGSSAPFTSTACSSTLAYKSDMATAFGVNPYVIVESYTSGKSCDPTQLSGVTTYLADGKCHETATASYRATRKADGSSTIKTYTDLVCATDETTLLDATAAQVTGNSCTVGATGIVDTKVYGGGATTSVYSSIINYDTNTGVCVSPVVPTLVATTPATSCTATSACGGSGDPYTRTACTSILTYKSDMATAFGSNPYVIVEKYATGQACASTQLSAMTTYLADGKCHKLSTTSYRATRKMDGSSLITTYTDQICTAGPVKLLEATAGQVTGNSCTASTSGIVDTKVYGGGATPLYLQSVVNYDTSTGSCKSPVVPTQLVTTVVAVDACAPTTVCAGSSAPFTSTTCSSTVSYKSDMAAAFGSNPYVIVEKYPNGQSCLASGLTKITTYLADGKCHMTASASYRATRKADGSSGVTTYTDTSCAVGGATLLDATTSQVTDSTCIPGATNGDDDRKVYGGGATPLYLQSIVNYDTMTGGCKSPVVPTQLVTTVVLVDACAPTTVCAGTVDPFTSTACSSTLTYKTDVAAAFVSSPYLIVESYTSGQSCDATQLSGITTYLADGKCHKTATASYRATRKADGSSAIKTYTGTSCAAGEATLLAATAAQVTGNSCTAGTTGIVDMKVYGGGGVTADVYSSTINYDTATGSCVAPAVPTEVVTTVESTSTCVATSVCAGVGDPYTSTSCTSALTYKSEMAAVFGSNPYVIVEKYTTTKGCSASQQIGTTVFLADAKCHKIDASGSYAATISSDGVSTVKMYTDATCGSTATTLAVSAAQATSKTCVAGIVDTLVYAGGATPWMWSAVTVFDDKTCAKAVQSTVTRDFSCTVGACVAAGDRSFSNACPEKYLDFAKLAFKSDPYVVAEVYQDSACATLQGVMVYSADTKCHVTMDGAASFTATLDTNGAGVIVAYDDNKCTDSTPITTSLTSAQLSSHSCVSKSKFYAFNVPAATSPPSTPTTAAPETPAPTTTTQTPTTPANAGSGNGAGSLYSSFAALATGFTLFGWMAVFLL